MSGLNQQFGRYLITNHYRNITLEIGCTKTTTLAGFRYNRVPSTTTPRPIPIPGIDFPFHIPPSGPLVEEEEDEYDQYDYKEYEHHDNYDRHDVEYDDYSGKSSLLLNHSECKMNCKRVAVLFAAY